MVEWDDDMNGDIIPQWEGENWEPVFEPPDSLAHIGPAIVATPFKWIEPSLIPPRKWLYGRHLIRGRVSLDVAAGGVGKTSLKIGEAVAMAAGVDLYNKALPEGPLRVWLYNLEDDMDELQRRVAATCQYFRIHPRQFQDRLFIDSGLDRPFTIATATRDGATIAIPVVEAMLEQVVANSIDVLIVDPFVSSHGVSENDNMAIDAVVKKGFVRIAHEGNCALNLVHHIRKSNGEEADIDSARGAASLVGAARSAVIYNRMSEAEATKAGVDIEKRTFYFKVQNGKSNLAPGGERADWYRMENCDLDNGDKVGVATQWVWPAPADLVAPERAKQVLADIRNSEWVKSVQSKDWVGRSIAHSLDLNLDDPDDTVIVKSIIKAWLKDGILWEVERLDQYRKMRTFIEVKP